MKNNLLGKLSSIACHNTTTQCPESIEEYHWLEWLKSAVLPSITSINVRSYLDALEVDKLLNRNNQSRWKHSDNLVPCWAVSGIDPLTDEPTLLGIQVKPDTPPLNKEGKPQKYIGASKYSATPLFLNTGIEKYWKGVIDDKLIPVLLAEGAKKAGAGLSIGHATISIPGVSTCRKKGRLHRSLELFTGFGRVFYFAFDNDVMAKRQVQTALLSMARELAAAGSKVMVICLPPGELKGMDDFIAAKGKEAFDELVESALTIEEWHEQIKETWREQLEEIKNTKRSKVARYAEVVRLGWGHELKYNELKSQIELSNSPIDLNQIRLRIALEFDVDVPMQDAQSIVESLATENTYHPVADYLDTLAQQYPQPDLTILDNLAQKYFGTFDPLHNIYLKKTLIAAVARIKKPGCKHDTSTILVGKQGAGKSTFWRHLFGDEWFTDELGDANEKDELMKLHRFWCLEWSEFETVYKRKDVSSLKKFMTSTIDAFRTPYSRSVKEYPRSCVLVGTTNEQEILSDPTGSRRFWIIPVNGFIPLDQLDEERDQIWAAAYALYQSGEKWWLNQDESELQEEINKDFQTQDPWAEPIQEFLQRHDTATISQIFHHLSIEPSRQDVGLTKRITSILRRFNWESTRKFLNGVWVRMWQAVKINVDFSGGSPGSQKVDVTSDASSQSEKYQQINVDFSGGSPGSEKLHESFDTTDKNDNFLVDRNQTETLQQLQQTAEIHDPGDPPENPTFIIEVEKRGVGFSPSLSEPIKIKYASPLGDIKAIATPLDPQKWEFHLEFPDGTEHREEKASNKDKAPKRLKSLAWKWQDNLTYRVNRITKDGYEWVEGCKCSDVTRSRRGGFNYTFKSPAGEEIHVFGNKDFEVMPS